tara:strand:- start:42328 stop:42585 length:258 start_codon:yes stop_codon:yes gene_type:complete
MLELKVKKKSKKELKKLETIIIRKNRSSHKGQYHDPVRGTIAPLWQGWHKIDNKDYYIKAWPNLSDYGTRNLEIEICIEKDVDPF